VAVSCNCVPDAVFALVQEEESRANQKAVDKALILRQATSPTLSISQSTGGLQVEIDIFDAMKCTIGAVSAEINRNKEIN